MLPKEIYRYYFGLFSRGGAYSQLDSSRGECLIHVIEPNGSKHLDHWLAMILTSTEECNWHLYKSTPLNSIPTPESFQSVPESERFLEST